MGNTCTLNLIRRVLTIPNWNFTIYERVSQFAPPPLPNTDHIIAPCPILTNNVDISALCRVHLCFLDFTDTMLGVQN